jgi:hypothetical protein
MTFAVLIIMAVYTFFYDRAVNGNPDILNVVSNAAFVLVSLSLHKLVDIGFEIGVFTYFLGCFAVQLFTINWMLIFIAIFFGCPLFVMHSSPNSQPEVASDGSDGQHVVDIDSSNSGLVFGSDGQHVVDIDSSNSELVFVFDCTVNVMYILDYYCIISLMQVCLFMHDSKTQHMSA